MSLPVGDSIAAIRALPAPVARSCHVGNNTSNNWGWLALAENSYMVQFDHTLYGVDEVCAAWTVLGDRGVVEAFFDPRGTLVPQAAGLHLNSALCLVERRHTAHLNYGIFASLEGADLISQHYAIASRLAQRMNGSRVSMDSLELLSSPELLTRAVSALHGHGMLLSVFNRWVKASRRGHVTMHKILAMESVSAGRIKLLGANGERFFEGHLQQLLELFFEGMRRVSRRITDATKEEWTHYPWLALGFNYLTHVLKESALHPEQDAFWHAGGSASAYYVNVDGFREEIESVRDVLVGAGALHPKATLRFVPTLGAQLFATCDRSLRALDALLDAWEACIHDRSQELETTVEALGNTTMPVAVVDAFYRKLAHADVQALCDCMATFNDSGVNLLPIAHASTVPCANYTKYGVAQRHLLDVHPLFPERLHGMRWGEAELLIKVLAQAVANDPG